MIFKQKIQIGRAIVLLTRICFGNSDNIHKVFPTFSKKIFQLKKENMRMYTCQWICTKISSQYLKWLKFATLKLKRYFTFCTTRGEFDIFSAFIFLPVGTCKKLFMISFRVLYGNLTKMKCISPPRSKLYILTFLTSWPRMALSW